MLSKLNYWSKMETFSRSAYNLSALFPLQMTRWSIGKCFTIRLAQGAAQKRMTFFSGSCWLRRSLLVNFRSKTLSRGKFKRGVDRERGTKLRFMRTSPRSMRSKRRPTKKRYHRIEMKNLSKSCRTGWEKRKDENKLHVRDSINFNNLSINK